MSDMARPPQSGAKAPGKGPESATVGLQEDPNDGDARESLGFLAPAQTSDELGRLAHYRVLKILGRGGMGTVFLAEDTRLHRLIALKVMLPSIAKKKIAYDRFKREAHATAKIEHDHIVTIYEVNEDRGVPYLAMQFLKGMTLEDWLKAGKSLNIPQIMRVGKEIAKGLAAAHSSGLIHRDIKPSNIWLDATNKGRVKILDFGLARPTTNDNDTHLTQEGIILGSPAYMSPEQARGQDIDERSDLFSLGCVLYRLCTGRLPFSGKDTMSMLLAITSEQPSPLEKLNSSVPASMVQLIHQMLAKKPADRPDSARAVVQMIQNIEREWASGSNSLATSKVTESPAPALERNDPAPKSEEIDPSLEDSVITEFELQQPLPSAPAPPMPAKSHMTWILAGLSGVLVTIVSVTCCLLAVLFSNQGHIHILAEEALTKTHLQEVGVTILHHENKEYIVKDGEQRLPAGGYHVKPGSLPKGMQLTPEQFTLPRGETVELKLRLIPPEKREPPLMERATPENVLKLQGDWARYLGGKVAETNSIGMKLALIPAGEFSMGSTPEFLKQHNEDLKKSGDLKKLEKNRFPLEEYKKQLPAETPLHTVRITKPFYMGLHEVTVDQFIKFVTSTSYVTEMEKSKVGGTGLVGSANLVRKPEFNWRNTGFSDKKVDQPVSNVTWGDAEAFCQWLSKKENKTYRLPTEAEWEYACRAGSETTWHFVNDISQAKEHMYFLIKDSALGKGPHQVGRRHFNLFGLFDMYGNVDEMCSDFFSANYYANSPPDDPKGPANDTGKRVARGGSFKDVALACRSAYRNAYDPQLGYAHVGFRVVCETQLHAD